VRLITTYNQPHDCNLAAYTFDAGPIALVQIDHLASTLLPPESESYIRLVSCSRQKYNLGPHLDRSCSIFKLQELDQEIRACLHPKPVTAINRMPAVSASVDTRGVEYGFFIQESKHYQP
jgi:hypothetical protein